MFLAACVQLRSTDDVEANLATAERLIRRAASYGAKLVATPENTSFLGPQFHKIELAEPLDGPIATRLRRLADELSIHLLVGSIAEQRTNADGSIEERSGVTVARPLPSGGSASVTAGVGMPSRSGATHVIDTARCFNTSLLFGPSGDRLAVYRKIHLFDVDVPGGVTIRESDSIAPGDDVVVVETALGRIGMSVCYDLRFAELYRALVDRGADILAIPSAFTLATGKDHWHPLMRARAIETQCWVLAPAQWGTHDKEGKRASYGHSLIVDPWGAVVAERGDGEGLALAEIDLERSAQVRRAIPVRDHRRIGR